MSWKTLPIRNCLRFIAQLMKDLDFDLREFQRVVLNTTAWQQQVSLTPPEGEDFRFLARCYVA